MSPVNHSPTRNRTASDLASTAQGPKPEPLGFQFPLPRTHTGIAAANARLGVLVWGAGQRLSLTVARTGFWDRQGGSAFESHIDFHSLRKMLLSGEEQRVRDLFSRQNLSATHTGAARIDPTQLPGGRLDLQLPTHESLDSATLLDDGDIRITLASGVFLTVHVSMQDELLWVQLPAALGDDIEVTFEHCWAHVGRQLTARGYGPPVIHTFPPRIEIHTLFPPAPTDLPLSIGLRRETNRLTLGTALGGTPAELAARLAGFDDRVRSDLASADSRWWSDYHNDLPVVDLPDPKLMQAYRYGVHRFAGLTHPSGVAATLQGPWMESYQLPPWSNDYHFNINLQMCYAPAFSLNRTQHLQPLWDLLRGWLPQLRRYANAFFGSEHQALMLPHAVDDTCQAIGTFWQGTIDHASTAWMALLAWQDFLHSGDQTVFDDLAWPLLNGAFNGFWAMLDGTTNKSGRLSLPISVSAEYGEGAIGMWGANASFQLAAIHALAEALPRAALVAASPCDPRWLEVTSRLPPCSLAPAAPPRIGIWDGQDLGFSHRHHSHLAGLWPFATLDILRSDHRGIIDASIEHWVRLGAGAWCAWCLPWASMICTRSDRPDAALAWLHWLIDNCENEGGAIGVSGVSGAMNNWCGGDDARRKPGENFEIMQLDAHMGLVAAVHELLAHSTAGEIRVLPRIPWRWREMSFDHLGAPGGLRLGATVRRAVVQQVRVRATRDTPVKLRLPGTGLWARSDGGPVVSAPVQEWHQRAGQTVIWNLVSQEQSR